MMQDMIIKPARCAGLTIPDRLVRRLIQDAGSEPGSLPLLAFALERLFQERSGNVLSESVYDALGGIAGAIGAHVNKVEDQVAKQVGSDANTWLSKIFQPLVVVNIDGQPTRRRELKQTFAADLQPIVDLLSKERLLSAEGEGHQSNVSVAHETLFETWPALTRWVAENRDDLFVLRQAEIEAKEWVKHDYDLTYLWHRDRLARLREIVHRVGDYGIDATVREYVAPQDRLLQRLHKDLLSQQERLTIGHYLAALGDPRRGVGLTADGVPDIHWVVIPPGNVNLEEVEKTFRVNSFRISRYLVTNRQFESFINAEDGYHNPEWWEDIEGRPAPKRSFWFENNSPRTHVSWYEAVAFCRWLSKKYHERGLLGKSQEIRLPAEWEWQQAATGGDAKNDYPWGPKWNAARCNSLESELRRTTTVGVYPNGATTHGVLDMAGNVREWCRNKYDNPDGPSATEIDKSVVQRVIRGGSWDCIPENLRASFRDRRNADFRDFLIGFRLACDLE
jgi:formylglycine-generating enzyme required for sulfatase activity